MVAREIYISPFIWRSPQDCLVPAAQQSRSSPQLSKKLQVEPLTQLSPTFPNTRASASPETLENATGQTIYVPAYSHVYYGDGKEHLLATTLSIRNTSLTDSISVTSVRYYDSKGKLVKKLLKKSLQIPPMATAEFFVKEQDTSGGSGANLCEVDSPTRCD